MKKNKLLLVLFLTLGSFMAAHAQSPYKSAIGLRAGFPPAVSYKQFISDQGALEFFAGAYLYSSLYSWVTIGGAYQHHFPIGSIEGFHWYVGGGAATQFWNYDNDFLDNQYGNFSFGLFGVGGIDYKFSNIPLNLSADIMPGFLIGGDLYYSSAFRSFGGVSARWTFRE